MPTSGALTAPIPGFYNRRGVHVGSTREPGNGTMSPSEGSVSHWLGPLREGDPDAAQRLWERYFQQLIELARKKLRALPHREAAEECRHLLGLLGDPELESVALLRMEGYTVEEIAERLGYVPRTIKRKLRLIRGVWEQELAS